MNTLDFATVYTLLAPLSVAMWEHDSNTLLIPRELLPKPATMVKWRKLVYNPKTKRIGNAYEYKRALQIGPVTLCNAFPKLIASEGPSWVISYDYATLTDPFEMLWCPCCGTKPILEVTVTEVVVRCGSCRLSMVVRIRAPLGGELAAKKEAVERWNRRTLPQLPTQWHLGKLATVTVHIRKPDATPHRTKASSRPKARNS